MKAVAKEAEQGGCGMIKWYVAKWNERGIQFYERLGATIDPNWHEFQMSEKGFRDLVASYFHWLSRIRLRRQAGCPSVESGCKPNFRTTISRNLLPPLRA